MLKKQESIIRQLLESVTPDFIRLIIKRIYKTAICNWNKYKYIKKGRRAEWGYRFRFERKEPYCVYMGSKTIIEEGNVWNANSGNITVGDKCWIGLYNIVMGPADIGNSVSTGPHVFILGPRHPTLDKEASKKDKTVIGNNVW